MLMGNDEDGNVSIISFLTIILNMWRPQQQVHSAAANTVALRKFMEMGNK